MVVPAVVIGRSVGSRRHRWSRTVNRVHRPGEATVTCPGAAKFVAGGIGNGVVVNQVQPERACACPCTRNNRVGQWPTSGGGDGCTCQPGCRQSKVTSVEA